MRYDSSMTQHWMETTRSLLNNVEADPTEDYIKRLIGVLEFHEYRYYVLDKPLISDADYDRLFQQLKKVESSHPHLKRADSPTQRVGSDITDSFPAVPHLSPMLSLDNAYNEADLEDFDKQVRKLCQLDKDEPIEYVVEPKFDGGTLVLVYEDDLLIRGATRGNGTLGEEITHNARAIRSIPIRAAFSEIGLKKVELRGEAIIKKSRFNQINETRERDGKPLFANPRNAATGGLRVKDSGDVTSRGLEAFVYQISFAETIDGSDWKNQLGHQDSSIEKLGNLGFKIPHAERKTCKGIQEVAAFCRAWEEKRDGYDYEIDGMVVKVNDFSLQDLCGSTSHHPRWAIAFKFKAKQAHSKLLAVEYQVGKTGAITPVAKIEPVPLAGVTVSSISLHNEDFIQSKDIRIGDTVLVERAGDVIPYIVKAMDELRTGSEQAIHFPTQCPSCASLLQRSEGEAAWRCVNASCPAQSLQKIIHHVSKDGMDIEGLGKSQVERFAELGWLTDLSDVYRLDYEKVAGLEGMGVKSATNLRNAIEKAKKNPIKMFLQSLSIHHLGKKASSLIAAKTEHVLDLANWTEEDYIQIHEIGPVLAKNMVQYFSLPDNIRILQEMESLGVNLKQTEEDREPETASAGAFAGKTILFTGTLSQMSRPEAQKLAAAAGAKNISAVSNNLDYLVAGEKAGSKLKKAAAIPTIQILSEEDFLQMIAKVDDTIQAQ